MEKHFLKHINCVSYKSFKDFKVDNLKRINLIGGKNNIGKTALIEACYINLVSKNISLLMSALHGVKYGRENLNILMDRTNHKPLEFIENSHGLGLESNINKVSFQVLESNGQVDYKCVAGKEESTIGRDKIITPVPQNLQAMNAHFVMPLKQPENAQYLDSYGMSYAEIRKNFDALQIRNKEDYLNKVLKRFDNNINGFKIIDAKPQCEVNGRWLDISEMGDGTRHLISVVTSLFYTENGYLFIDEIENGVHYTYLPYMWKIIFEISKEMHCQVFATTHSRECIEAFNELNKNDDGTYIELYRNEKDNSIVANHRDYEQLNYSLTHKVEFRGE